MMNTEEKNRMKKRLGYGLLGLGMFCLTWFYALWVIPTFTVWRSSELYGPVNALYIPVTVFLVFVIAWSIWLVSHNVQEKRVTRLSHFFIWSGIILCFIFLIPLVLIVVIVSFDWIF